MQLAGFVDVAAPFLMLLGGLIFVHELGHFLVAKWFHVKVEEFSIGFGPAIVRRRLGETEYRIAWLPLGGYCKMLGELPGEELPPEDFTIDPLPRPTEEFLTRKLWDVGSSDPYGHRGDLTTMTEAIQK